MYTHKYVYTSIKKISENMSWKYEDDMKESV